MNIVRFPSSHISIQTQASMAHINTLLTGVKSLSLVETVPWRPKILGIVLVGLWLKLSSHRCHRVRLAFLHDLIELILVQYVFVPHWGVELDFRLAWKKLNVHLTDRQAYWGRCN